MPEQRRKRLSLSIRLQPYEGDPLAEVAAWLNEMVSRDANRLIENALLMAFLAYARFDAGEYDEQEIRRACLECCDALDKHASKMRQAMRVEQPSRSVVTTVGFDDGEESVVEEKDVPKPASSKPSAQIKGKSKADELGGLFGNL